MQLPNIEEMSSEEKKWFAYSIAGMVVLVEWVRPYW